MEEREQKRVRPAKDKNRVGEGAERKEEKQEVKRRRNSVQGTVKVLTIPEYVKNSFRNLDGKYYFKDQKHILAFEDKGKSIVTQHNDDRVAKAFVKMAEAKEWRNIKVTGNETFRREVWLQAQIHNIKVKGFTPKESDIALLNDHGKNNEKNLADLRIDNLDRSPQASILKAVAKEVLKEKVKNPKVRQAVMNEISQRLERGLINGKQLPDVLMYDKNAKSIRQDKHSQRDIEKDRVWTKDRHRSPK